MPARFRLPGPSGIARRSQDQPAWRGRAKIRGKPCKPRKAGQSQADRPSQPGQSWPGSHSKAQPTRVSQLGQQEGCHPGPSWRGGPSPDCRSRPAEVSLRGLAEPDQAWLRKPNQADSRPVKAGHASKTGPVRQSRAPASHDEARQPVSASWAQRAGQATGLGNGKPASRDELTRHHRARSIYPTKRTWGPAWASQVQPTQPGPPSWAERMRP